MPTYEYACTTCDEQIEVVQRFTDDPLTDCPACTGRLRKVFSPVGVVFKGSGFYKTDSRGSRSSSAGTPSAASSAGSSGASSASSDAPAPAADKPAAPSKPAPSGTSSERPAAAAS